MSYLSNQWRYLDNLTVYLYGLDYVLSNGGMILALQGQGHTTRITEIEKITYFGEITGPRSLSIQHYSGGQIPVGIFQKHASSTSYKLALIVV